MKSFDIGYTEDKVRIHPRMASVAEVEDYQQQFNDVADNDTEKYQKYFDICKSAIEDFSAKPAEQLVKEKGEFKAVALSGGISGHFEKRTPENERIVRDAYKLIIAQMSPESAFI
jgi:hypothetical protein